MQRFLVQIYSAIRTPFFWDDRTAAWQRLRDLLFELASLSGRVEMQLPTCGNATFHMRIIESRRHLPDEIQKRFRRRERARPFAYLCAETQLEYGPDELVIGPRREACGDPQTESDDQLAGQREGLCRDLLGGEALAMFHNLVLVSHIARPGILVPTYLATIVDGEIQRDSDGYTIDFESAIDAARKTQWPPMLDLPVEKVWYWALKVPGFSSFRGEGRCGRALAVLSHLLEAGGGTLDLLWVLMGLEALYSKGHEGLKFQLTTKTEVLLGHRETNKRVFGRAYDVRSSLVHGALDLAFAHSPLDALEDRVRDDLSSSKEVALAVFLSTLQQMVVRDLYDIEFEWKLVHAGDKKA